MSLQWTLVTWFVYAEVAAILAMCLPLLSVQRWRRILRSRLVRRLDAWANVYFNVLFGLLAILLVDAWRKSSQYSHDAAGMDERVNPHGFALARLRKVRAQSNFMLSGGSLLLWLVLKWIVSSLIARAFVEEDLAADRAQILQLEGQLAKARSEVAELKRRAAAAAAAAAAAEVSPVNATAAASSEPTTESGDKKTD